MDELDVNNLNALLEAFGVKGEKGEINKSSLCSNCTTIQSYY